MRVYVETNFLLEVVLEQAEVAHAEQLIDLAVAAAVELVVPAVCLLEAQQTLHRRDRDQRELLDRVQRELVQLGRSQSLAQAASDMRGVFVAAKGSIRKRDAELLQRLSRVGRCDLVFSFADALARVQRRAAP